MEIEAPEVRGWADLRYSFRRSGAIKFLYDYDFPVNKIENREREREIWNGENGFRVLEMSGLEREREMGENCKTWDNVHLSLFSGHTVLYQLYSSCGSWRG